MTGIADTPWRDGDLVQRVLDDGTTYALRLDAPMPGCGHRWFATIVAVEHDRAGDLRVGDGCGANRRTDRKIMHASTRTCATLNCPGPEVCPFPPIGRRCAPGWGSWRSRG